ncbi:hypothetical protein GCM10025870_26320 [Agromyces marinus]|uniref:Uncharacterized protein n=1 Tax=Agromyces marinus TaxID=1389020 RepID=A0ABM8H428_9MICO|nr:hypothetical protein GCM10025870_26320 [Agromyces marinus]
MTNSEAAASAVAEPTGDIVVEVRGVTAGYLPGVNILNDCSLTARQGNSSASSAPTGPASRRC